MGIVCCREELLDLDGEGKPDMSNSQRDKPY